MRQEKRGSYEIGDLSPEGFRGGRATHLRVVRGGGVAGALRGCDGSDLGVEIAQGPMAEKRALEIIRGVAAALAVAHDEGIVHRDIKPTNILLDKRGEPKLLDLGIAKQIGITSHTMTRTGEALGTPSYMSPEQCRAERDIDGRSDIYSLGATLFHMMCRRPPFKARSAPAVMHMQVYDPLPDPRNFNPSVSAGMASLIRRMMGKARSERFQSCAELEKAIKHLEQGRTEAVPATARAADDTGTAPMLSANSLTGVEPDREPAFLRPARARRSWAPVAAIAALVAGVAMIGAAVVMLSRRPSATESAGSSAEPSTAKESTPVPAVEEAGGPRSGWTAESARVLAATAGGDRRKEITYYTNSIGMKLVRIPAGEFVMGSESGYADEKPAHRVRIGNAFFMGAHEVTNAQWKAFISANVRYEVKGDKESGYGSHFSRAGWNADDQPMCHVNWHHAQGFCEWLSGREGVNYRLPSEAEWEYACRAGSSTKYYWGDSMRDDCAWYSNNSDGRPHSVGGKRPNAFGLYDMIGNVPEWGRSVKKAYPYLRDDGREYPSALGLRAVRGGSYDYYPSLCRSANRNWYNPDKADTAIGFRVVCLSKP